MKKNKLLKLIVVLGSIAFVFTSFSFASVIPGVSPSLSGAGGYASKPTNAVSTIIGSLRWIGYVIAIGMLVYIGIRYIVSSADEKASLKGLIVKVAIGSVIIITANIIVNFALNVAGV